MYCRKCGTEFLRSESSCPNCGAPNVDNEPSLMDFYEDVDENEDGGAYFVPPRRDSREDGGGATGGAKRRPLVLGVVVGVVLVCAAVCLVSVLIVLPRMRGDSEGTKTPSSTPAVSDTAAADTSAGGGAAGSAGGSAAGNTESDAKAAAEPSSSTTKSEDAPALSPYDGQELFDVTALPIDAPGLDDEGSRIPLLVTGTRSDGSPFSEEQFVGADGLGLRLPAGTYTARVIETPITVGGYLYNVPTTEVRITVQDAQNSTVDTGGTSLEFTARGEDDVTSELIERAHAWILRDPQPKGLAEELATRARERYLGDQSNQTAYTV